MPGPYKISDLTEEAEPVSPGLFEFEGPDGEPYKVDAENIGHSLFMLGRRNLIINGGFEVAQRVDPTAQTAMVGISTRAYGPDRWSIINENTGALWDRVDTGMIAETGLKSRYVSRLVKSTAAGQMGMYQIIEGAEVAPLRNSVVRVSAKMKKGIAATMDVFMCLVQLTSAGSLDVIPAALASAYNTGSSPYVTLGANLYLVGSGFVNASLTNSWEEYTFTATVPNTCKNLILLIITQGQVNALDQLFVAEAGVYAGSGLVQWMNEDLTSIIQKCQRFYSKTFPIDQAPIQNWALTGSKRASIKIAAAVATSWNGEEYRFPVRMRIAPAITFYNPAAANAFVRNVTLGTNATATAASNISDLSCHVNCTGLAAWVVGNDSAVHISAEAEL
jgi:hypothetical protein